MPADSFLLVLGAGNQLLNDCIDLLSPIERGSVNKSRLADTDFDLGYGRFVKRRSGERLAPHTSGHSEAPMAIA